MANDNAFWARPGSEAAKAAEASEPTKENIDEIAVSSVDVMLTQEAEIDASKNNNFELSHRDKQTDFFNSMSGVEQTESEQEKEELYTPTDLLEVPYNDTPHNLGYHIPKMRFSMSKQTKHKVITFSSIFSGIAAVIAAVIILNGIFGFIPTVKRVPVIYSKGNKVYLTSTSGELPEQMMFDGTPFQISSNSKLISFSPNNEDVLVSNDISAKNGTYSRDLRNDVRCSEQGKLIDRNIIGDFEFAFGGDAVLYIKSKGTNDLYFRNLSDDSSIRIERKIELFGMLDDTTAVMMTTAGTISTISLNKDGTFTGKEIAKSAESVYLDEEPTNAFYYTKIERNTETSENVDFLYRYHDGDSKKVAEGAQSLIAYSCVDNWAYYSKTDKVSHALFDFLEDDCLESDKALTSNIGGMNFSDEVMLALRRNFLRNNMEKASLEMEYTSIGYYSDGKAALIESGCTEIYAIDMAGQFVPLSKKAAKNSRNQNKCGLTGGKSAAIMYESAVIEDGRILVSSIPGAVISSNTAYEYITTLIESTIFNYSSNVISDGRRVTVDTDSFTDDTVSFSSDYTSFYYISDDYVQDDTEIPGTLDEPINENARAAASDSNTKSGDLMCVNLKSADGIAQPVALDVKSFEVLADGSVIYINADDTVFIGSVALSVRVKDIIVNRSRNAVAILGESTDTGALLTIYKDGATKPLAENVNSVAFNDDTSVSFVKDYDKTKARGDLYVCRNFGTPSRIDTNVSSIINYPY